LQRLLDADREEGLAREGFEGNKRKTREVILEVGDGVCFDGESGDEEAVRQSGGVQLKRKTRE